MQNLKNRANSVGFREYQQTRTAHWDALASEKPFYRGWGDYYHRRIEQVYRNVIPSGRQVLELGCAEGDLLAAIKPANGVGVDFSTQILSQLWEIPLSVAGRLGLARTRLYQNWLTVEDIRNLLALSGWEVVANVFPVSASGGLPKIKKPNTR
jgi:hypothetical protein